MENDIIFFINEQYKYVQSLPEKIKNALNKYTTEYYKKVNDYLENDSQNKDEFDMIIRYIDIAIYNAPKLKSSLTLYRGLNLPEVSISKGKGSRVLFNYKGNYKGYISTTLDKTIAETYTRGSCCVLEISVPKGTPVLYLSELSEFTQEDEVLLYQEVLF